MAFETDVAPGVKDVTDTEEGPGAGLREFSAGSERTQKVRKDFFVR